VILIGAVTLILIAEFSIPTAFNRHMLTMQLMAANAHPGPNMQAMQGDLFNNFRAAVTESLLVATGMALISAILVSVVVSRRIVIPIQQMMQASRRIAAGRYQERVEERAEDELGQLAASFNQMAHTLEQTEAMRRDLIGNVAHELRTPLSSIQGYMEGLIDGVLPAAPETYQQVYREADRLQRLVSDLQELSRVEAGAFELKRRPLAIAPLVEQAANRLRPQFEEKGARLRLELPATLPPVLADQDRLDQVLLNLVGNALQYTPKGGQVSLSAEATESHLNVIVQDTGQGIAAEHLPHLFTRFYRVDKSRSRAGGGSGIGLTIAKHLVEAHGGRIWAESRGSGQGSTFGFSLPLA
jgi:histidine kinase